TDSGTKTPGTARIHDIQGGSWVSPYDGKSVGNVPGIVTAVRTSGSKGFWFQDPNPDADPATSEGLFVYTGSAPTVAAGDSALDYYESIEGMRVEVDDARVVGPSDAYGEQYVTTKPAEAATYRGGAELLGENQTPSGRLEVVAANGSNPEVSVGDVFSGATI